MLDLPDPSATAPNAPSTVTQLQGETLFEQGARDIERSCLRALVGALARQAAREAWVQVLHGDGSLSQAGAKPAISDVST